MNAALHLDSAITAALETVDRNLVTFADIYPDDATECRTYPLGRTRKKNNPPGSHTGWTTGFWPGMLWLAYELTRLEKYRAAGEVQVERFADRLTRKIDVDHHDIGFLYSLSCVAAYRLTGSQLAHQTRAGSCRPTHDPLSGRARRPASLGRTRRSRTAWPHHREQPDEHTAAVLGLRTNRQSALCRGRREPYRAAHALLRSTRRFEALTRLSRPDWTPYW